MTPAPDDVQIELFEILQAALPEDPFLRYDVEPGGFEAVEVQSGVAAAWLTWSSFRQARWVTAIAGPGTAEPDDPTHLARSVELAVTLLTAADDAGQPVSGVTVPRGGRALLPERWRPGRVWEWDWWFTEGPVPAARPGEPAVVDVAADDPRLEALLAVASPDAPIRPGDPRVARWAAIEDPALPGTGGLAAMVAVTHLRSGVAHLNDVATHPERRRLGLAGVICATVTREALTEGRPAVTLGMYADNDPARALYGGLGFTCTRRHTSGSLG